jgi:protein-S-isoprenylcysteine O-methyltransferase Ste14
VLLLYASPWNALVLSMAWLALWLRAGEEERFLLADPAYAEYAARVRYRLVPGLI